MNLYHIWCNLRDSRRDMEFVEAINGYLGYLKKEGKIAGFRLTRRKLGFGPENLGEFHIVIETDNLVQLENAFDHVATRSGEVEELHRKVFSAVTDFKSALYRDFPGEERRT